MSGQNKLRVGILISGAGRNLQAFIDGMQAGYLDIEIAAVISNRADAYGLKRARDAGLPCFVLLPSDYPDKASYDAALSARLEACQVKLVVLAGFMRILTAEFVDRYAGRLINIHPSLLPKYPGLHTHQRALAAGDKEHGASVHFVTEEVDAGPVIIQGKVPVLPGDSPDTLADRVMTQEVRLYPTAVQWLAEERLVWRDGTLEFDGEPMAMPQVLPAKADPVLNNSD